MSEDLKAIEAVIKTYLDGLYEGDADKLAKAFHPTSALAQSLVDVKLIAEGSNQSIFLVDFGDKVPTFATGAADATHPTVRYPPRHRR